MNLNKPQGLYTLHFLHKHKRLHPKGDPVKEWRGKGYYREEDCDTIVSEKHKAPLPTAEVVFTDKQGIKYYLDHLTEEIGSKSFWNGKGLKIIKGRKAFCTKTSQVGGGAKTLTYDLFRKSDTEPKRTFKEKPAVLLDDILLATFIVNRAAKRFRDSASKHYENKSHGFAKHSSSFKSYLYRLKDKGVLWGIEQKILNFIKIQGGFGLWGNKEYSFHTRYKPKEVQVAVDDAYIFIDQKPANKKLPRLKDAVYTLEQLPTIKKPKNIDILPTSSLY